MKTTWISVQASETRYESSMTGKGVLSPRAKEMIAMAICIVASRENSGSLYGREALKAGASPQEILEVIRIATRMGGDRSVRYGAEAVSALKEPEAV